LKPYINEEQTIQQSKEKWQIKDKQLYLQNASQKTRLRNINPEK